MSSRINPKIVRNLRINHWQTRFGRLKRCQEPFWNFWQDFRTMLVSFWLLSDNIGLPGAEMQRRIDAELRAFAPYLLPDSALSFESSNERRRLDRSARECRLTESKGHTCFMAFDRLIGGIRTQQSRRWNGEVPHKLMDIAGEC